jgi:hypothetical protein
MGGYITVAELEKRLGEPLFDGPEDMADNLKEHYGKAEEKKEGAP